MVTRQAIDFIEVLEVAPSAPKTGHAVYGNLLKLSDFKCLLWNGLPLPVWTLLISVALECFDSYKIDYSDEFGLVFLQ